MKTVIKHICLLLACWSFCFGLRDQLKNEIVEYKKNNNGQLSLSERLYMAEILSARNGCNCLIFGVGNDTRLWMKINQGGRTVFLEDDMHWLNIAQKKVPESEIHYVYYGTRRGQWKDLLDNPDRSCLKMHLPDKVINTTWNVIIVDAPTGYSDSSIGRMKSIFTASQLAQNGSVVDIFVHDCDRVIEDTYSTTFLGAENLVMAVDRLRHYRIYP